MRIWIRIKDTITITIGSGGGVLWWNTNAELADQRRSQAAVNAHADTLTTGTMVENPFPREARDPPTVAAATMTRDVFEAAVPGSAGIPAGALHGCAPAGMPGRDASAPSRD